MKAISRQRPDRHCSSPRPNHRRRSRPQKRTGRVLQLFTSRGPRLTPLDLPSEFGTIAGTRKDAGTIICHNTAAGAIVSRFCRSLVVNGRRRARQVQSNSIYRLPAVVGKSSIAGLEEVRCSRSQRSKLQNGRSRNSSAIVPSLWFCLIGMSMSVSQLQVH
jgi:hypothetical protein